MVFILAFGVRLWRSAKAIFKTFVRQVGSVAAGRYELKVPSTYLEFEALSTSIGTMASAVSSREIALRSAISERDSLLKEVHHRVKNNMQIMISLLNLEMRTLHDTSMAEIFTASVNRIRSMSLIHETLYGQEHLDSIELNEYTRRLIGELTMAYGMYRVKIELDLQRVVISLDHAMPCGLILNELMTNAFKYAIAGRNDARIKVQLGIDGGFVALSVCDDGPGLDVAQNINDSHGLGMQLIHSLTDQLGGTIRFDSRQDGIGLRAVLRFPYGDQAKPA